MTNIIFDEFYPFSDISFYKNYQNGELKALSDWCYKYSRTVDPLCRSTTEQCAFMVKE